jgi:hypothetical protein
MCRGFPQWFGELNVLAVCGHNRLPVAYGPSAADEYPLFVTPFAVIHRVMSSTLEEMELPELDAASIGEASPVEAAPTPVAATRATPAAAVPLG